ncbi:AMP-binding enzyme [Propionibacterium sp.]|uniref:AMP-binding enzyme n=1 Tax=Propionibacterium sp. TaxID=1977903 RepID=UPI0039EB4E88
MSTAAVGVADLVAGESVELFVVSSPGGIVSEADGQDFLRVHLAKHKLPRRIHFEDALPMNQGSSTRSLGRTAIRRGI